MTFSCNALYVNNIKKCRKVIVFIFFYSKLFENNEYKNNYGITCVVEGDMRMEQQIKKIALLTI